MSQSVKCYVHQKEASSRTAEHELDALEETIRKNHPKQQWIVIRTPYKSAAENDGVNPAMPSLVLYECGDKTLKPYVGVTTTPLTFYTVDLSTLQTEAALNAWTNPSY